MLSIDILLVGGAVSAAVAAAALARRLPPPGATPTRHASLQGFRGLLALGVFLHHAFIWFHYTHGLGWSDSSFFRQFGQSRVILFFMLAAMLFYGRLLDERGRKFDWLRLYVTRLLRLAPAYWLAMGLMIVILIFATTHHIDGAGRGNLLRTWPEILRSTAVWLNFSMLGMPPIDGYFNTRLITAAVTWTMPFECTFYLLMPLLALPLRIEMPATALGLGLAAALWLAAWAPDPLLCLPFTAGMGLAVLVRVPQVVGALRHRACAAGAIAAMTAVIFLFPMAYAPMPLLLLGFSLAVVAAGNDLFGILQWRATQALGNCSYSLYLLHGIALYTLFLLVIGADRAAALSIPQYFLVIALFTPIVLALAWASQRWVESPALRAVPFVVASLRRLNIRRRPDVVATSSWPGTA